jgi:hypothetical protein
VLPPPLAAAAAEVWQALLVMYVRATYLVDYTAFDVGH